MSGKMQGKSYGQGQRKTFEHLLAKQNDLKICMFPVLSNLMTGEPCVAFQDITSEHLQDNRKFCELYQRDISSLLIVAWSIILHRFSETDMLCFGISRPHTVGNAKFLFNEVCYFAVKDIESVSISNLLEKSAHEVFSLRFDEGTEIQFNTGIAITTDGMRHSQQFQLSITESQMCDILLIADISRETPKMLLRYSTSTISPQQASRLANTVAQAIRCVLKNPNQILSDVDLISTQELRDISHWNSRDLPAVYSNSITEIITAKSLSRPGAQAIYSSDRVLSYYDINMLSSRLAVYLRELGVGTNVMVPLCFEKSIWAVVATLAVLKAGAASVPLDASHPLPRLKQIIRQVNATVVITSTRHLKMLEGASERVITVSESLIMQLSNRNEVADAHVLPHHLAYVLFTSGSTGSPKGCIINHQALAAAANQGEALQISADSRVLQFASPSFGVSLIEIFCTLSAGGTICIPSEDERINDLTGAINRMMVNWALLTPSLINSIESSSVPRLETLVVAGEPSNKEILENWIQKVHLIHAYGLTEWVGICTVQHMTIPTANPRCIGKSPNANLWLVNPDNHNILAPIGALAELLIEGSCLAQGYLNDAQRTAASFVAMPSWLPHFQPGKARRLYKTGDLVRYNHDGTINFITRKDTQVKIRGQRIELGEVEYHVCRHFCGATKIIADMITPRNSETPFLTAFVFSGKKTSEQLNNQPDMNSILASPNETFKSNSATARAITREYLPDYMVPQVTLPLKYIPVTVTGKVDRHTLRRIAGALSYEDLISYSQIQSENVSPRSSIEHLLHQSFARVLNLKPESFGVNDSFFLLGGDSIKAMQLANRFRCDGLYLSVPDIFRDKTVANLSFHASITPAMTANNFPSPDVPRISLESILQLKTGAMGITQKDIETVYPCSPVQNGMLLSQARESQYYRMHFVWEITATGNCTRVDSHKLQDVWHQLIYRHPMLRTVFLHDSASAHHFIQVVLHEGVGKASVVQCDNDFAFNANESRQQTDLRSKASLPKVKIRETSSGRVLCALDISHVQVDATSLEILKRDLVLAYDNKLPLPTGKNYGEYSNYVASLPKRLVLDYWIDYLAGCHPCHFPPLKEHLTKFHQSAEARSAEMALKNVTELRAFCSAKGLTMSNILQVAWGLVLQVYTGSDTVCFGYLNSSRDVPIDGIEDVVGPVINMLICRIDFTKIATRLQLVRKTQSDFVQALPWQCFLLSDLFHAMSLSGSTMFNTCMTIPPEEPVSQTSDQNSIKIKEIVQSFQDEYDVTIECRTKAERVNVIVRYRSSIMTHVQATNIAEVFDQAVTSIIKDPEGVGDESLLSVQNLQKLKMWNQEVPVQVNRCMHELIQERCKTQPEEPAVCAWDGDFKYGELDVLSDALAAHLADHGVGPEVFVPLCFEKSRWTTVAILGVMKAGGAFILLDPSYPATRLREICHQVSARLIVTSTSQTAAAGSLVSQVISIGVDQTEWRKSSGSWKGSHVAPSNALYAVFTSGSTGNPKGAVIAHSAYCSSALAHSQTYCMTSQSRVFQFASYAFDASILEILTTLFVGACICVPSDTARQTDFVMAANQFQVSWVELTPSTASLLQPQDIKTIQTLVLMGEPLTPSQLQLWASKVQVIIAYGPAECAVVSSARPVMQLEKAANNIGRGLGCVCWVVDPQDHEKLQPIGAVGELLIEGPIVGRGYLNNPQQTTAAFIEPPTWLHQFRSGSLSDSNSLRLYKTGDLVQYTIDGSLCFVGRKDTQVKIRGQRLELGEVENCILRCFPGAHKVVVELVTPVDSSRQPMLVAFIHHTALSCRSSNYLWSDMDNILKEPTAEFCAEVPGVEARLHQLLPAYMVPTLFLPLATVPLTATGKIDRRRLRECGASLSPAAIKAYSSPEIAKRMPTTAAECLLQRLWARVLNISPDTIGADDSFFRLGGDSITAMRLASTVREAGFVLDVSNIFHHPKLSELPSYLQSTSTSQSEAINPFSLVERTCGRDVLVQIAMELCEVSQDQIVDIYPCTPLQEGLMALTARAPGAYTANFSYRLSTDVDIDRFHAAWNAVARANPILNTRFIHTKPYGSFQVVIPGDVPWSSHKHEQIDRIDNFNIPFRLGKPLLKINVIESDHGSASYRFCLTIHHLLYDAWSLMLLLQQVDAAYHGQQLLPRSFSPFIAHISGNQVSAQDFWRSDLADLDIVTFPALPAPNFIPHATERQTHVIQLQQTATDDVTLSTRLRLAWAITLSHYTNTNDIVFGLTVAGRGAPVFGIEAMTGPTIATIPLRTRLHLDSTVAQALQEVQGHLIELLPYEQIGLQNIQQLSPDAAAACQFQNLLIIQPHRERYQSKIVTEEDTISNWESFTTYALTLLCDVSPDSIMVHVMYDQQVIEKGDMQLMLHHFSDVLEQLYQRPNQLLSNINKLSASDLRQLQIWNQEVPVQVNRCMHELIQERCKTQPEEPAVCAWDGDFKYGELDVLSDALAAHLADHGVGPEVFVPLCFEKSRWTTVAILGVMKAGGAFILLDPSYPATRLREICHQVSARLIIASTSQTAAAGSLVSQVISIGVDQTEWRKSSGSWKGSHVAPSNSLYAVFTSGSTGNPKGAVISHSAYCSSALAHSQTYCMTSQSRVFQFASYAFDVSIVDHLTALQVGCCICIPSDPDRRNKIAAAARQLQVSWAQLTPSTLTLLQPEDIATLKTLILGGEPLTPSQLQLWTSKVQVIIAYGPAECAVVSSARPVMQREKAANNIGRGLGCVCWVVDPQDHEKLQPIGAVGELLIEGPIVGRGYLNNPQQTTAAFIEPPTWLHQFRSGSLSDSNSLRLYKTGDLVQYTIDGSLCFVGRKDTQVKIRGQRLELGEVEYCILQCFPGAHKVVVELVTPVDSSRQPMLVAFIHHTALSCRSSNYLWSDMDNILKEPTAEFCAEVPGVEARLHQLLPAYMVPTLFLPLAAVPLTATGKTDRRRLRECGASLSPAAIKAYSSPEIAKRMPTTAAECLLQRLWARVLNISPDTIGADDSFFRLGGDSITAMQLSALLHTEGFLLSVSEIFQNNTLSQTALSLTRERETVLSTEESVNAQFDLSPIQRLFFDLAPAGPNDFHMSFLIPVAETITSPDIIRAINNIVQHHSMLRARFCKTSDNTWTQFVTPDVESSYRFQKSTATSLSGAADLIHASQHSLDIKNGPLFSVDLIETPVLQQYLYLLAHHLIVDMVSWRIILGDLEELLKGGRLPICKPLPFQTWCRLQAEYSIAYLTPEKAMPFRVPVIPIDYWGEIKHQNTPKDTLYSSFSVSKEVTIALFGQANDTLQTQPVEILQAAIWHSFVHTFPARAPPVIFNAGHGREPWHTDIDLSRTVGWFTTMWPTYLEPHGRDEDIVEVIRRTKDTRRRTPNNGWAYFTSRFINPYGQAEFKIDMPVEITFNYLGMYQQLERVDAILQSPVRLDNLVPYMVSDVPRFSLIDVYVTVEHGCLQFDFYYNRHMKHLDAIGRWFARCHESLLEAADRLLGMDSISTPSNS